MRIFEIKQFTDQVYAALLDLLPQLNPAIPLPSAADVSALIASDAAHLLVAEVESNVCGSLTLGLYETPTGIRAWIEDVVVDRHHRRSGVGKRLVETAIGLARTRGARTVNLTSHPLRAAANRLYKKVGFEPRETNLYRYDV